MNIQKLKPRKIKKLIEAAHEDATDLRYTLLLTKKRLEKNLLYQQIENREIIIKKLNGLRTSTAKPNQTDVC